MIAFYIVAVIAIIAIWLLLSFGYNTAVGGFAKRLFKGAVTAPEDDIEGDDEE